MTLDSATLITIVWGIVGAIGTMFLGLIAWGIKSLITATINNTTAIKVLTEKMNGIIEDNERNRKLKQDVDEIWAWKRKSEAQKK